MVILFADKKTGTGKEISEILRCSGISIITEYEKISIKAKNSIAVFAGNTENLCNICLSDCAVGICEDSNLSALKILMESGIPVITCGMNPKNTVTLSSLTAASALVSLQRTVTDIFDSEAEPGEFRIKLNRGYSPFAVTASAAVLLFSGILPDEF